MCVCFIRSGEIFPSTNVAYSSGRKSEYELGVIWGPKLAVVCGCLEAVCLAAGWPLVWKGVRRCSQKACLVSCLRRGREGFSSKQDSRLLFICSDRDVFCRRKSAARLDISVLLFSRTNLKNTNGIREKFEKRLACN